jgi:hypothetical protein
VAGQSRLFPATARNTTTGTSGFIGWVWPNAKKLN